MQQFEPAFFAGNRAELAARLEGALTVISANALVQQTADIPFKFRQESNFWYLTGINQPEYVLVQADGEEFLIAPEWDTYHEQWDGVASARELKALSGVKVVLDQTSGWERLAKLVKKHKKIHFNKAHAPYIDIFNFYANPAQVEYEKKLQQAGAKEIINCKLDIAQLRQVKQKPELAALQKAVDITSASLEDVRAKLSTYKTENEIEADLFAGFRKRGATGHAYDPIVASGEHAATIHYMDNNAPLDRTQPLLMDVGASYGYYGADISRTWLFKKPTKRQKELYDAIMRVYDFTLSQLKPGVITRAYEKDVDAEMRKELHGLGLLDDIKDTPTFRKYYPHLTSHFLGLDVHDAADYDRPLEAGMVLTVEPGVYIPKEHFGLRIEDDVVITSTGCRVMSQKLSRDLFQA